MATLRKTDAALLGLGQKTLHLDCRIVIYDSPIFVANDVVEMVPIYADETVIAVSVLVTDLDTDSTPAITFDVGDGDNVDRYIDGSTVAQTGGLAKHTLGCPFVYTVADTIDFKVITAPDVGVIGTVTMTVLVT